MLSQSKVHSRLDFKPLQCTSKSPFVVWSPLSILGCNVTQAHARTCGHTHTHTHTLTLTITLTLTYIHTYIHTHSNTHIHTHMGEQKNNEAYHLYSSNILPLFNINMSQVQPHIWDISSGFTDLQNNHGTHFSLFSLYNAINV